MIWKLNSIGHKRFISLCISTEALSAAVSEIFTPPNSAFSFLDSEYCTPILGGGISPVGVGHVQSCVF